MEKKIYRLRHTMYDVESYYPTLTKDIIVVASSQSRAIKSILKSNTVHIEVLGVHEFKEVD